MCLSCRTKLCCFTGVRLYIQERILHLFDLTHRSSVLQTQNAVNYLHDGLKPAKLTWTAMYRKQHQKVYVPGPLNIIEFPN
ncbi:hypothetical protein GW17_00053057 [Ensete ventricosum]|nr:hypothetical protein GW17_00053057 [Ensete ventricosum]